MTGQLRLVGLATALGNGLVALLIGQSAIGGFAVGAAVNAAALWAAVQVVVAALDDLLDAKLGGER